MALLKALIGFLLIIAIVSGSWWFYENYNGELTQLSAPNYDSSVGGVDLKELSGDVNQFYANMRFNHNQISYYINPNCDSKKNAEMTEAFSMLSSKTENLINFYQTNEDTAEILVGCSVDSYQKEKNIFIAGEGGPTKITNSSMPIISRGKVLIYNESASNCDEPLLELHELLHVFGYNHVSDSSELMYPYLNCKQEIGNELTKDIIRLYSIKPFADIYFNSIVANKEKYGGSWYLNFNVSVINNGIIDAENSALEIRIGDKLIESFDLDKLNFGAGKNFYVKNLKLTSSNVDTVRFELKTDTYENNLINNIMDLKVEE